NGSGITPGNAGALRNISGNNSWSGAITLGSAATIESDANLLTLSGGINNGGFLLTITGAGNTTVSTSGISGAGGLTKTGAGTLTLGSGGTNANTYTGVTTVSAGEIDLNKANGTNAIAGDGNTGTTDVTINGGTLKWLNSNQVADDVTISMSSGTMSLNGQTETLFAFTNSGGTFTTGAGTLIGTGNTITWSGGTNTINDGGTVEDKHVVITGGTNNVQGGTTGGRLIIDSGGTGLEITGATLTVNSDDNAPGKVILDGDVTSHASATTAVIASGGAAANAGTIDLDGGTRTFTTEDGAAATDMSVSAQIVNGGLTKAGAGLLALSGANTYSGGTTVSAGTLMVNNTSGSGTGTGSVTVTGNGTVLGGSGTISGAVTIGNGSDAPVLRGGTGATASGSLTVGNLTMNSGSIVQLALGTSLSHSTLALTGTYSFQSNQTFQFINLGATTGTYDNIITGTPTDPGVGGWQFDNTFNPNFAGSFFWDGSNVDLTLVAVPEPGTWAGASLALVGLLVHQRRRLKKLVRR
ncbi:MAG: beta strand repeat-containing protein, partial [Chthoniobacterales bacterium]